MEDARPYVARHLTSSRLRDLGPGYHGVVRAEVLGWSEVAAALNEVATKFPNTFTRALAAECANLKRSIAATLRNYRVTKAVPVPNLIEATSYRGYSMPKRSNITKLLTGPKNTSALANPATAKVQSIPDGFEIGHFGRLGEYAVRFQQGVPRQIEHDSTRRWMYFRLGSAMGVHTYEQLASVIAPISPPRPYIEPLTAKTKRDFVPGLVKCFEKIASGEMRKAQRKQKSRK